MKYFITVILCAIFFPAISQMLKVVDRETGDPLILVTIISENLDQFVTTNEQGEADITLFQHAGQMEIRYLGYKTILTNYRSVEKDNFIVKLFHAELLVDDIVVTATRIRQDSKDIPYQVATLTARDVALQNPQTAADLLGNSDKIFIQKSQQGGGSPMIRGFSANRLLYTIDGVRMNTAIFRSGNIQNVISLDPFTIDETDIYFGPSSVIYGSDALGGVMSFQTITPKLSSSNKAEVNGQIVGRYATANQEKTGHLHFNLSNQKWASLTSISTNDFGDLKMGANGPDDYLRPFYVSRISNEDRIVKNPKPQVQIPSGYEQLNLLQKIRYKPNLHWDINYGFHFSTTSDFSRYDRHLRNRQGRPQYGEWSYGPQKWMMNLLQIDHYTSFTLFDEFSIRIAHQNFEESRRDRNFNESLRHVRSENVDAYSVNLDFFKRVNDQRKIFFGMEAVINDVTSLGIDEDINFASSRPGPSRYPQAHWSSLGWYFTYQQILTEGLTWQTGLRFSQYRINADFDTTFYPFPFSQANLNKGSLTGSTGLVYRPLPSLVLTGNFATGFRAPNVDDIGKVFDSEPGAVIIPNPELQAEYAYNVEFGITKILKEIWKIDISLYYTLLDDAMVRRSYQLNGRDSIIYDGHLSKVQALQNAAQAALYGLQAGMEIRLPSGFLLNSNLNIQKGIEELDDGTRSPSRHAAPSFGVTRITYHGKKFNLQFYAVYSAAIDFTHLAPEERGKTEIYAKDEDGNPYSPRWYTFNVKSSIDISPSLNLTMGIENLTNQRYRTYSSGITAGGINLIVALRAAI